MPPEPPSPSSSSVLLPFLGQGSRRGSLASNNSKRDVDKDVRAQALDSIHGTASKSELLTSFHDYDGESLRAGTHAKDVITSGMTSLYNRFKSSVKAGTPPKDTKIRPVSQEKRTPSRKVSGQSGQTLPSSPLQSQPAAATGPLNAASGNGVQQHTARPTSRGGRSHMSSNMLSREHARDTSTHGSFARDSSSLSETDTADEQHASERSALATYALAQAMNAADGRRALSTRLSEASSRHSNELERQRTRSSLEGTASRLSSVTHAERANNSHDTAQDGPERPPLVHIGVSHLPGFQPSELSSPVLEMPSSRNSQIFNAAQLLSAERALEPSPNINSALQRRRTGLNDRQTVKKPTGLPHHLKRRVISKEFWMKDENAKVCFDCGQTFTAFRRKHHCRTCGQIFDAKCTSLVDGRPFAQPGTLRLCKACEDLIFGSEQDDSSVYTDDAEDEFRTPDNRRSLILEPDSEEEDNDGPTTTPSIGIPVSRRNREAKKRSAVIEFDAQPTLIRPASSRSLLATARPRSSSHKRHQSRAQSIRSSRPVEDNGPFAQGLSSEVTPSEELPVFHNDNVIDPDLAPYMSDEESDDEGQPDIFTTMNGAPHVHSQDRDRPSFGALFSSTSKKGRPRTAGSFTNSTRGNKDDDATSTASRHYPHHSRKHTASFGSVNAIRPSPRRSRSHKYLHDNMVAETLGSPLSPIELDKNCTKIIRSCAMRGPDARPVELSRISFEHVRKLLAQLLADAKIQQASAWEKALLPIVLQCTEDVNPDVPRGDDMDIRHYIKLKKVPGGKPGDTSYVSGVVFSKNIALKSMARSIRKPRIAIVTFAIEYARREAHFMSLGPVIAQEKEYLHNLVSRIVALRPQLLLVQKRVSGLALDMLAKAGITVAYNIKESVLAAVARVTQTTMIKSVDKLTIDPHQLGHCEGFDIKTYIHESTRKSYIVLSGCQPDLGCTVVLRGADTTTLRRMKRITEFMCYVVYNLKLETYLLRDEFIALPTDEAAQQSHGEELAGIEDMSEHARAADRARSRIISASPFVVYMQPHLLTQLLQTEKKLADYKQLRDAYAVNEEDDKDDEAEQHKHSFRLVEPAMVREQPAKVQPRAVRDYLYAAHDAQYDRTMATYEVQRKLWQSFTSADADPFDPYSHQAIVVLHSVVSSITSAPCIGPELLNISFYASYRAVPDTEEDCTLGQYIEDVCFSAADPCKGCNRKMLDHHRQYVHGNGQLSISVQRQPARLSGMNSIILMWSTCKICAAETTVVPMSDSSWKFSFAKYLESSFWSRELRPRAGVCGHDVHKDFIRCFGYQDVAVRVQYVPIDIYDVVVPRPVISWRVEADLAVKNEQYQIFESRLTAFIESVKKRLGTINVDTLDEKQMAEAQNFIESLRHRADEDHQELLEKLQAKYSGSKYYELIPLNRALRFMDKKALAWDEVFNNFERDYFPSETDIRKLAAAQLKEMFYGSQATSDSMVSAQSDNEAGSELTTFAPKTLADKVVDGEVTEEKTHDVLACVAQEHRAKSPESDSAHEHEAEATRETAVLDNPNAASTEDVKHLDLAIPESATDATIQETERTMISPTSADSLDLSPTSPEPLSSGLVQRIEQIRKGVQTEKEPSESRIPRLSDLRKREESVPNTRPRGFSRARSQPTTVPQTSVVATQPDRPRVPAAAVEPLGLERRFNERLSRLSNKLGNIHPSLIPRSVPTKKDEGSGKIVSALAKHFEHLSREFERERLRERRLRASKSRQARANPLASSRPVVEVYNNATEAVNERQADSVAATLSRRQTATVDFAGDKAFDEEPQTEERPPDLATQDRDTQSFDSQRMATDTEPDTDLSDAETTNQSQSTVEPVLDTSNSSLVSPSAQDIEFNPELSIPEHKRNVWFKVLAEFWSKRSASGWSSLEYPLHSTEHVFEDSDIIVREDEPSSVIALSLSSSDYLNKVNEFRSSASKTQKSMHDSQPDSEAAMQSSIESSLLSDTGTHMRYSFSHGPVKTTCKIFYAEAFDALRRRCGVTQRFVESLSRCMKFDSKGGKTKSLFLKTLDNRFIIKSLQEVEVKAFTRFAPDYFAFMSHTLFRGVPSVIAKMFGLFQVTIKNPASGMDFNCYLLVMENLFYDHVPDRRFDLKGSMRNRKIESTGQPDEVLLDENLVETIFESPLFVREHSRRLLQASVWNDTLWLCKQNVMDYSLMAGFEDNAQQLVVGIIDCIRTYTWDKRLETWIKDRGKNKPTITSPKDYRNRFRVSMTQYVLQAPSCWHQFQVSMAAPKTLKERDDSIEPEPADMESKDPYR